MLTSSPVSVAVIGYSHIALQTVLRFVEQERQVLFVIDKQASKWLPLLPDNVQIHALGFLNPEQLAIELSIYQHLIIASDDEHFNLHLTLAFQSQNPQSQIVTRLFNLTLGRELEARFPRVRVLSVSKIAAPYFVASAFVDGVKEARQEDSLLTVATEGSEGLQTWPLEAKNFPQPPLPPKKISSPQNLHLDPLLFGVLGLLGLVICIGTVFFNLRHGLALGDALYFVVTTLTTTGYGDYSLKDSPFTSKLMGMGLMLAGGSLFAILFALLTDKLFGLRLNALLGRQWIHTQGHIIVCGAGDLGVRLAECLHLAKANVVFIEKNSEGRFNSSIRALKFPLLIADATLEETLLRAGILRARALICATDHDLANLEMALNARALRPDLRIVVRIFECDFAEQTRQNFEIDVALSSSTIASNIFAQAILKAEV